MAGAEDVAVVAREVTVLDRRQGPAGVGAGVDEARDLIAVTHHEAREQTVAVPEAETPGAGIGDLGQRAQAQSCGWSSRISRLRAYQASLARP